SNPDRDRDSIEEAAQLRDRFPDCAFVVVENAFLPKPGASTQLGGAYRTLAAHRLRIEMPALEPDLIDTIESPGFSLSDLMPQPLSRSDNLRQRGELSFDARAGVRAWMIKMLRDIHRVLQTIDRPAERTAETPGVPVRTAAPM